MFKRKITRFQGVSSPALSTGPEGEPPISGASQKLAGGLRLVVTPHFVIGLFAIAYASLGFLYYQAYQRESEHLSATSAAQASLAAQPDNPDALRSALSGWTAALQAADQMRVQPQFDSSLLSEIMTVADSSGAQLVSAGLQSDAVAVIAENEYLSTPIRLRVNGSLDVIRDFIARLENGAVVALEVQSSDVTYESDGYSAIINVVVFSQPDGIDGGEG